MILIPKALNYGMYSQWTTVLPDAHIFIHTCLYSRAQRVTAP